MVGVCEAPQGCGFLSVVRASPNGSVTCVLAAGHLDSTSRSLPQMRAGGGCWAVHALRMCCRWVRAQAFSECLEQLTREFANRLESLLRQSEARQGELRQQLGQKEEALAEASRPPAAQEASHK